MGTKNVNPAGSPRHSFPRTLPNELLQLYDAREDNIPVRQFKCSYCTCVNTYVGDSERAKEILVNGKGMLLSVTCKHRGCHCHTGFGTPVVLATRVVDWGDIPF